MPPKRANARTIAQTFTSKRVSLPEPNRMEDDMYINALFAGEQTSCTVSQSSRPQRSVHSIYRRITKLPNTAISGSNATMPSIDIGTGTGVSNLLPNNNTEMPTRLWEDDNNQTNYDEISTHNNDIDLPETHEVINEGEKKSNRKPTKLATFRPLSGQKHIVFWCEGQPVSKTGLQLSEELGYYARIGRVFPLHKEWGEESRERMNEIMVLLEENFIWESADEDPKNPEIPVPLHMEVVQRWCTLTVQSAIRGFRNKLKHIYYKKWKHASPHQRDQIKLERITRTEWENLFEYFESPQKKEESIRNMSNVNNKKLCHCLGQRSFAQTKKKLKSEGDDDCNVFVKSHKKMLGKGDYPNDKTREICEKVIKRKEELTVQLSGSDPSTISQKLNLSSILGDVVGRHHRGYETGYGNGYLTRQMRKSSSMYKNNGNRESTVRLQEELNSANRLIRDMQEDFQEKVEEFEREKAHDKVEREEARKEFERQKTQDKVEREEQHKEFAEFRAMMGSFMQNQNGS